MYFFSLLYAVNKPQVNHPASAGRCWWGSWDTLLGIFRYTHIRLRVTKSPYFLSGKKVSKESNRKRRAELVSRLHHFSQHFLANMGYNEDTENEGRNWSRDWLRFSHSMACHG